MLEESGKGRRCNEMPGVCLPLLFSLFARQSRGCLLCLLQRFLIARVSSVYIRGVRILYGDMKIPEN